MRKWMTFLMTFLVGASSYVNADNGTVAVELGYRNDRISLKNYARGEDVHNEFKDLDIFQIGVCARGNLGCNFYGRASGDFGWILDGKYRKRTDTDTSGSFTNRGPSEENVVDDKYVFDANVAVGYPFYFCDCTMELAPTVGYSFNEQNVRVESGFEDSSYDSYYGSSSSEVRAGSFEQKFINRWYGPFIGFDFQYRPYNECWNLFTQFEYHFAQYKGRRNDGDVGSNHHTSLRANRGHGYVFNVGAEYDFCNCWTASIAVKFSDFAAHKNHGHCCDDNSSDYYGSYPSGNNNEAHSHYKWYSTAVTFAVGRAF